MYTMLTVRSRLFFQSSRNTRVNASSNASGETRGVDDGNRDQARKRPAYKRRAYTWLDLPLLHDALEAHCIVVIEL